MKKTILTLVVAIATMIGASAQTFTVVSTYNAPAEGADLELGAITDNLGVMVSVANNCMFGMVKNGEEYDLFRDTITQITFMYRYKHQQKRRWIIYL